MALGPLVCAVPLMSSATVDRTELLAQQDGLRALACVLTREDAEDHVQDAYVAALANPAAPRSTGPWMRKVLRNGVFDKARRSRRRRELARFVEPPPAPELPEDAVANGEVSRILREAMEAVGSPYREVIELRFFEDRNATEIGRELDIPPGTVRWRLHEGLERMRSELDERAEGRSAWTGVLLAFVGPPPRIQEPVVAAGSRLVRGTLAVAGLGVAAASVLVLMSADSSESPPAPVVESPRSSQVFQTPPRSSLHAATVQPRPVDTAAAAAPAPSAAPSPTPPTPTASEEEVDPVEEAKLCMEEAIVSFNALPDGKGDEALAYVVEGANCAEDAHLIGQSIQLNQVIRKRFPDSVHAAEAKESIERLFSRVLDADAGLETEWGRDCVAPLEDDRSIQERQAAVQCLMDAALYGAALELRRELGEDLGGQARQANLDAMEKLEEDIVSHRALRESYLNADFGK